MHAVPLVIQYQGHIQELGTAFVGDGFFKFLLVGEQNKVLWHHDTTSLSSGQPAGSLVINVSRGAFSIGLGGSTTQPLNPSIFTNDSLSLRVWFGVSRDRIERLIPDRPISAVAFAIQAQNAVRAEAAVRVENLGDASVAERHLQPALLSKLDASANGLIQSSNAILSRLNTVSNPLSANISTASNVFTTGLLITSNNILTLLQAAQTSVQVLSNALTAQVVSSNALLRAALDAKKSARVASLLGLLDGVLAGTNLWTGSNHFVGPVVSFDSNNVVYGRFTGRFVGDGSGLTSLPSTSIAGQIPIELIPGLDASWVVSGAFSGDRLAPLDASKIATGVLDPNRIPLLDASKISTGTLNETRLDPLLVRRPELTVASNALSERVTFVNTNLTAGIDLEKANRILALAQALRDLVSGTNTWTGENTFTGVVRATHSANQWFGNFSGNGGALTNVVANQVIGTLGQASLPSDRIAGIIPTNNIPPLDGAMLTSGTVPDDRISTQLARTPVMLSLFRGLDERVTTLSNRIEAPNQAAAPFVSSDPADSSLLAKGLQLFLTIPAPGWVAGTSANAPSARYNHSAVWTGSEFIVWGGNFSAQQYSDSGARYKPDVDTWQNLSPLDAPSARSGHSAVWTGTEMIVWGGFATNAALGTGGRYNPSTGKWAPVSSVNAPSAREGHIAVWTGSRMVVWGGDDGN